MTLLTPAERNRLVELIDLCNDLTVTQIDHHESTEMHALWRKLLDAD